MTERLIDAADEADEKSLLGVRDRDAMKRDDDSREHRTRQELGLPGAGGRGG